jgi:hypothetical protein
VKKERVAFVTRPAFSFLSEKISLGNTPLVGGLRVGFKSFGARQNGGLFAQLRSGFAIQGNQADDMHKVPNI